MEYHPKIICLTGYTGTGKSSIAQKLVRDHKYHLVNGRDFSTLQLDANKVKQNIEALKKENHLKILIDDFQCTVQSAEQFQSNFYQIQTILNLKASEQTILKRLVTKESKKSSQSVKSQIQKHQNRLQNLIYYYSQFGIVQNIETDNQSEDQVYEKVKKSLLPKIIILYGPPKTGKTTIGDILSHKIGYQYINLRLFTTYNFSLNKNTFQILHQLIQLIKNSNHNKFVIDDLFTTAQQYKIFKQQFGQPQRIFEFQLSKDQVQKNISHQTDKQQAKSRYISFIQNRDNLLSLIKNKNYYHKINASKQFQQLCKEIMVLIKPTVLAAIYISKQQEQYLYDLQSKKNWRILDIKALFQGNIARKSDLGRKLATFKAGTIPAKGYLACFRNSLFGNSQTKFILKNLGDYAEIYELFEKQFLFNIKLLSIEFMQRYKFLNKQHSIMYFFERGDVIQIQQKNLDLVDGNLVRNVRYGIIFGAQTSGKSTLCKLLAKNYNLVLIDWQPTLNLIKQKYLTQQQKALQQVPFPKVLKYLKQQFTLNQRKTFIFDGFPYQKNLDNLIKQLGAPAFFLNLKVDKQALVKRTRVKNQSDVNAELGQQQSQKIDAAIQKSVGLQKIADDIAIVNVASKSYAIQASGSIQSTLKNFQPIFSRRVFLVNQQIVDNQIIEDHFHILFKNMSYNNNIIFVDVNNILIQYFHLDNPLARQLQNQYKMRSFKQSSQYNTKNYNPNLIVQIINEYLIDTNQTRRDILLINYPTHDPDYVFPRVSDQFAAIQSGIGKVRLLCRISRDDVDFTIKDPKMQLIKPVVQVKQKKQGEEAQQKIGQQQQKKKPAFNIYDYNWTNSNGNAKDLNQWFFASKTHIQRSKLVMANYEDFNLFDHFEGYVSRIRSDPNSHSFIEVKRLF